MVLLVSCVLFLSGNIAFAQPSKEADLLARIQKLEKRIDELELLFVRLRASAKEDPRTEVDKKLVGSWLVSDADRKQARVEPVKRVTLTDLRFKGDGTCGYVIQSGLVFLDAKYQVIGKQMVINYKDMSVSLPHEFRIESVTETELVLEDRRDMIKVRYLRAK
jgi:hypothetical protein